MPINPLQVLLWTFRRNEQDVINLYSSLAELMQLATGGKMLNFGYWNENTKNLTEAQDNLCTLIGKTGKLHSAKVVIDVGSGFSAPAANWKLAYNFLEITCVNINFKQLKSSKLFDDIFLVNSTSIFLPFANQSVDRVIALESAQHFKPINRFISESKRILKQNGFLVLALPVVTRTPLIPFVKLGILSMTWSSEHYTLAHIKSIITEEKFEILDIQYIGSHVYEPLANYYLQNREKLRKLILKQYPSSLENILFKSLLKMKQVSQKKIIDYVVIKCIL